MYTHIHPHTYSVDNRLVRRVATRQARGFEIIPITDRALIETVLRNPGTSKNRQDAPLPFFFCYCVRYCEAREGGGESSRGGDGRLTRHLWVLYDLDAGHFPRQRRASGRGCPVRTGSSRRLTWTRRSRAAYSSSTSLSLSPSSSPFSLSSSSFRVGHRFASRHGAQRHTAIRTSASTVACPER